MVIAIFYLIPTSAVRQINLNTMIDYIAANIPLRHKRINAGELIVTNEHGEVTTRKVIRATLEGSYDSRITVRSQGRTDHNGYADELYIQGNPSKFLQGHNVFGASCLKDMLTAVLSTLIENNSIETELINVIASVSGATISRIDYTKSLKFQNRQQARAYIKQLSQLAHTRTGRPLQKSWTLAFQPNSRRWNIVCYTKGDEINKHKLHQDFPEKDYIKEQADNLVRVELRLRSLELIDLGLRKVHNFTEQRLNELYEEYIGRIQMSQKLELTSDTLNELSRTHRSTYLLWKSGIDVQAEMTKTTYYAHRSAILKHGVDISVPYEPQAKSNVIPLKQTLVAEPYQIPKEAYDKGLVFQPRTLRLI